MNVQHRDFTAERAHPKDDVLTASVPVTASLYLGTMWFADFEAIVSVRRDEADEVVVNRVEVEGLLGKRTARSGVEEAPRGFSIDLAHHAFDAVMDECSKDAVRRQLEEAMAKAEQECGQ